VEWASEDFVNPLSADVADGGGDSPSRRALSKQHLSTTQLRELSHVQVLQDHFTRLQAEIKAGSQTISELELAANKTTQLINEIIGQVIAERTVEATAAVVAGENVVEIRSLSFGEGSAVSILEDKSGPNVMRALFGSITEEEGGVKNVRHHFRDTVRSTQGRVYGSSFTSYDFRSQPEQLVILIDGKREHIVEVALNLPDAEAAVALLHAQPWIQRNSEDENIRAASVAATALAQKLIDEDPVGDSDPQEFLTVRCGCLQHNRLPRSLQTTAAIRCHRRFDTAIAALVYVLHQRYTDDHRGGPEDDVGASVLALAAVRIQGSVRRMDEVEGALQASNTGNVDLDFGVLPDQLVEAA